MAETLDLASLGAHLAMSEDRVVRASLIWSVDIPAPCDGDLVGIFGASLCYQEVVPSVLEIEVRAFRIAASGAPPNLFLLAEFLPGHRVDFEEHDPAVGSACVPALSAVEEKRRVDALHVNPYRIGPFPGRVCCVDDEVPLPTAVGGDHVEQSLVVADRRGIYSSPGEGSVQFQLRAAGEHVPYLLPVHEILAVEYGNSWEILE